jgi:hypothetical protein
MCPLSPSWLDRNQRRFFGVNGRATGLEPAASCVTGRRSNQLNYAPALKPIPYDDRAFPRLPIDSQNFLKVP